MVSSSFAFGKEERASVFVDSMSLLNHGHLTFGKGPMPRALTNPIYVDADGDAKWNAPSGKTRNYTVVE